MGGEENGRGWVPERGMVLRDFRARREMMNLARRGISGPRSREEARAVAAKKRAFMHGLINTM